MRSKSWHSDDGDHVQPGILPNPVVDRMRRSRSQELARDDNGSKLAESFQHEIGQPDGIG